MKSPTVVVAAPAVVPDTEFSSALHSVLRGGLPLHDDASLRLGVIKRALAHAGKRFGHGADERAMMSVLGAFYLLRPGDSPSALVDVTTVGAIDGALQVLSARGDYGKAKVLYGLERDARRAGAIAGSPDEIDRHLSDLESFVRETRTGTSIEIAGEVERAAESRAMLDPSGPALEDARAAISSYIDLGIQHNVLFKQTGRRPTPEEAVESTRALENGATTLIALRLRAGDLRGAFGDLKLSSAGRVIDPDLLRVLRAAVVRDDGPAWRSLFAELDQQASDRGGESGINEEVLEAAFFNVALEAYRRDPSDLGTTLDLARFLAGFGLSEGVPAVLADGLGRAPRAEDAALALRVFGAALDADAEAGDDAATSRTIAASEELLAIAEDAMSASSDARPDGTAPRRVPEGPLVPLPGLHPNVADIRLQIGEVEMHAGHLAEARSFLERAMLAAPSSDGLFELAMVCRQVGDEPAALEYAARAAAATDADPLEVAAAETLGFELHRDAGQKDDAARSLERALRATLEARRKRTSAVPYRVKVERTMGRILAAYGENGAAGRAFDRALDQVTGDRALVGATMRRSMGFCLLTGDVDRARHTLRRGRDAGASQEDLVYAALWLMLLEKQMGSPSDGSANDVLQAAAGSSGWAGTLAGWAIGRTSDADLMVAAETPQDKTEAGFYVAMRRRSASKLAPEDASALLKAISKSSVPDVLEVDLARELTAPHMNVSLPKGISLP